MTKSSAGVARRGVLLIQRRLPNYRVPLFQRMRAVLAEEGVDFTVAFGQTALSERWRGDEGHLEWGLRTKNRYLSPGGMMLFQDLSALRVKATDLLIVPHENKFLLNACYLRKKMPSCMFAFFGHGLNFQSRSVMSPGNLLKKWTALKTDWWFAYTVKTKDMLMSWGMPEERITTIDNAIDTSSLTKWRGDVTPDELEALKTSLGISRGRVGVFLGSIYSDKRMDFLLSSADRLKKLFPDFVLIVIGDGPLREKVRAFCSYRRWAVWPGALRGREKMLHLMLGRVMLNPGLVGLNILDSFASGLPMVTTDCMIHSPEVAYLRSGENGLITEDDMDAFVLGVASLMEDSAFSERLRAGCLADSKKYSIEDMADKFCEGIMKALKTQRRLAG